MELNPKLNLHQDLQFAVVCLIFPLQTTSFIDKGMDIALILPWAKKFGSLAKQGQVKGEVNRLKSCLISSVIFKNRVLIYIDTYVIAMVLYYMILIHFVLISGTRTNTSWSKQILEKLLLLLLFSMI